MKATDRLIAVTARLHPDPAELDAALSVPLDWPDVMTLLRHHRLLARAHHCWLPWKESVPRVAWRRLAQAAADAWCLDAAIAEAGSEVLEALAGTGLDAVPLKGPWLADRLGQTPEARPTSDLDLLVRLDDLAVVKPVLRQLGYERDSSEAAERVAHHHSYLPRRPGLWLPRIEVHHHLLGSGDERWLEGLWQRVGPRRWRDTTVLDLAGVDLVLFLAVHATSHGWAHLCHLLELGQALECEGTALDWPATEREAAAVSMASLLELSVFLAVSACHAPPPAGWPGTRSARATVSRLMLRRRGLIRPRTGLLAGPYMTMLRAAADDDPVRRCRRLRDAVWPLPVNGHRHSRVSLLDRAAGRAARLARQVTIAATS